MATLSTADLITHPLRARILVGLMGRELTTQQIAKLVPEVPRASLYRQIRRLLEGGILSIVREVPVRGTLEKVYSVRRDAGHIPAGEVVKASPSEHLQHFTSFVETMTAFYRDYLEGGDVDPPSQVTMVATPIYADDAEYQRFKDDLRQLIQSFQKNESSTGTRRILWVAAIPDTKEIGPP